MIRPPKRRPFFLLADIAVLGAALTGCYYGCKDVRSTGMFAQLGLFIAGCFVAFASPLWIQLRLSPDIFAFTSDREQREQLAVTPLQIRPLIVRFFKASFIAAILPVTVSIAVLGGVFLYVNAGDESGFVNRVELPFEFLGLAGAAFTPSLISIAGSLDLLRKRFERGSGSVLVWPLVWATVSVVLPIIVFGMIDKLNQKKMVDVLMMLIFCAVAMFWVWLNWKRALRAFSEF